MICILDTTGFVDIDGKLQPGKMQLNSRKKIKKEAAPLRVLAVLCIKNEKKQTGASSIYSLLLCIVFFLSS